MMLATTISVVCFGVAAAAFFAVGTPAVLDLGLPWFWILVAASDADEPGRPIRRPSSIGRFA